MRALTVVAVVALLGASSSDRIETGRRDPGKAALDFLRGLTLDEVDQIRIGRLIKQLDSDVFREREQSTFALLTEGPRALPVLRKALATASLEQQARLQKCIKTLDGADWAETIVRAARRVEERRPAGACGALLAFTPFADDEILDEVLHALAKVAVTDSQFERMLLPALDDPVAARRASAALIVGAFGTQSQRALVGRMLADADPLVRFRAASGLLATHETAVVPALIEFVGQGDPKLAEWAEELLLAAAGKTAPSSTLSQDGATRAQCHAAWLEWWNRHGARLDLAASEVGWFVVSSPGAVRIEGTTWFSLDLPEQYFTTYIFERNGRITYSYEGNTYTQGSWKQQGRTLYFEVNNRYRETRGTIKGQVIECESWNVQGVRWTTVLSKTLQKPQ